MLDVLQAIKIHAVVNFDAPFQQLTPFLCFWRSNMPNKMLVRTVLTRNFLECLSRNLSLVFVTTSTHKHLPCLETKRLFKCYCHNLVFPFHFNTKSELNEIVFSTIHCDSLGLSQTL